MNYHEPQGNPFTPDFGQIPPEVPGRDLLLAQVRSALASGPLRPQFTSLLLGPRGTGKTVAALLVIEQAKACGWRVLKAEAPTDPDPADEINQVILEESLALIEEIEHSPTRRFTGARALGFSARWENMPPQQMRLRHALPRLLDIVENEGGSGVLVVVDEFHNSTPKAVSQIAGVLQRLTKEEHRPLAFFGTALPHIAQTLLSHKGFTFFQRVHRERIGNISQQDAEIALRGPLQADGITCSEENLRRAAALTRGLPFAIQSIGAHLWDLAGGCGGTVTSELFNAAVSLMDDDIRQRVVIPVWSRLSAGDKRFLAAMSDDDGPSRMTDIISRLGRHGRTASTYKRRLLDEGVLLQTGYGTLMFASDPFRDMAAAQRQEDFRVCETHSQFNGSRATLRARHSNTSPASPEHVPDAAGTEPDTSPEVCGAMMPRARKTCVLPVGHRGSHRSKKRKKK